MQTISGISNGWSNRRNAVGLKEECRLEGGGNSDASQLTRQTVPGIRSNLLTYLLTYLLTTKIKKLCYLTTLKTYKGLLMQSIMNTRQLKSCPRALSKCGIFLRAGSDWKRQSSGGLHSPKHSWQNISGPVWLFRQEAQLPKKGCAMLYVTQGNWKWHPWVWHV